MQHTMRAKAAGRSRFEFEPRNNAKTATKDRTVRVAFAPARVQQAGAPPTRATVARRLGRSNGVVRFQEGKTLHPWRDSDGIWRFDPAEVEALASKLEATAANDEGSPNLSPGKLAARACQLFR